MSSSAASPASERTARFRTCSVCGMVAEAFLPSPAGNRHDVGCPSCGSLERHRFLIQLLYGIVPHVARQGLLLDAAPSPCLTPRIRAIAGRKVLRLDLEPRNRAVDVAASLTHLPLADRSVDVAICYHVLEHIPNDLAAMLEIGRILTPGGVAFIQVPWKPGPTDEDPEAGPEERVRRFGQADHVRQYGDDFDDRLARSGLRTRIVKPEDLAPDWMIERLRLFRGEKVWLASRRDAPEPAAITALEAHWPDTMQYLLDVVGSRSYDLQSEAAQLRKQRRKLLAERRRARARYAQLRRQPAVRAALKVSGLFRGTPLA